MKATLPYCCLLFSVATSNAASIPLSGPSTVGWRSLGANYDFLVDLQTGDPTSDIVGSASDPGFFTTFDNNNTPLLTDGNLGFRVRLDDHGGTSNNIQFDRDLWIGIDADLKGTIDVFLGLNMQGGSSSAEIGIYSPGTDLNISPNTTSIAGTASVSYLPSSSNFNYRAVDFSTDGGTTNDLTPINKQQPDPDYYVSFLIPFADIVSFLNNVTNPISINENTPIRYVLATSTNPNSLNQDIGGLDGLDKTVDLDLNWEDLPGGFTPTTTPSGVPECSASLLAFIGSVLTFGFRRRR